MILRPWAALGVSDGCETYPVGRVWNSLEVPKPKPGQEILTMAPPEGWGWILEIRSRQSN